MEKLLGTLEHPKRRMGIYTRYSRWKNCRGQWNRSIAIWTWGRIWWMVQMYYMPYKQGWNYLHWEGRIGIRVNIHPFFFSIGIYWD